MVVGAALLSLAGCAPVDDVDTGDDLGAQGEAIASAGAWYHLDRSDGLDNATLTVVNGYTVRCPDGRTGATCRATRLVLPADCNWECQDGLLGGQGETLLRGRFDGARFVVMTGVDAWRRGMGSYSVYSLRGAARCAHDPCPTGVTAQKLNTSRAATAVTSVDFSHADDTNFALDPFRADDAMSADGGLLATGRVVSHVFRVDRVFRLQTPRPSCEPTLAAHAYVPAGSADELRQFRTVYEAERFVIPEATNTWLVRTAETPTTVEFTSGINDLWAQRFSIARDTCAITVLAEH